MTDHNKSDARLSEIIHFVISPAIGIIVFVLMLFQALSWIHWPWPVWGVIILFLLAITDSQDNYISEAPQGDGGEFL